jgi:hypothetical protein
MSSPTSDQVKNILPPGTDDVDLAIFISNADLIVDEDLAGKGMTDSRLDLIRLYLSAHFAIISIGELTMKKIGDATDDYVKVRLYDGFRSSTFGQQAVALDTSGTLRGANQNQASFDVIT